MAQVATVPFADAVKKDSNSLMVLGIATAVLGILAMMAPLFTGLTVAVMVGILLVVAGITRTMFAFKCRSWGKGILAFALGLLALVVGVYMIARPGAALASPTPTPISSCPRADAPSTARADRTRRRGGETFRSPGRAASVLTLRAFQTWARARTRSRRLKKFRRRRRRSRRRRRL